MTGHHSGTICSQRSEAGHREAWEVLADVLPWLKGPEIGETIPGSDGPSGSLADSDTSCPFHALFSVLSPFAPPFFPLSLPHGFLQNTFRYQLKHVLCQEAFPPLPRPGETQLCVASAPSTSG